MSEERRRTVLITGASSGIGKATALYLAQKGHAVIGTSRSIERLSGLEEEASSRGLSVRVVELDINDDAEVEAVHSRVADEAGPIDVLVNNAGYSMWGPLQGLTMDELKAQFETNLFAAARLIKAVLPGMTERRKGTIINISSVSGRIGTPFNSAYCASKFALEGLSEALRVELEPLGVYVAVVEPGLFRTDFQQNRVEGEHTRSAGLPYGPYIERFEGRHDRYWRLAQDPIKVAKVVHRIVRSRRPAFRYLVGREARLGLLGKRLLPEGLFLRMVARATLG